MKGNVTTQLIMKIEEFNDAKTTNRKRREHCRFQFVLQFHGKHGVLHAGCGIGLNRFTQFVLGIDDIKATTVSLLNRNLIRLAEEATFRIS